MSHIEMRVLLTRLRDTPDGELRGRIDCYLRALDEADSEPPLSERATAELDAAYWELVKP